MYPYLACLLQQVPDSDVSDIEDGELCVQHHDTHQVKKLKKNYVKKVNYMTQLLRLAGHELRCAHVSHS